MLSVELYRCQVAARALGLAAGRASGTFPVCGTLTGPAHAHPCSHWGAAADPQVLQLQGSLGKEGLCTLRERSVLAVCWLWAAVS